LAVGPIDLDYPDPGGCHGPGQARPVAARSLDPDEAQLAETAQPGQQLCVAGRGHFERFHAQQAADRVQSGRHVDIGVGVDPARDGASDSPVLYDGHAIPFSR
jgi:hypothetical protein